MKSAYLVCYRVKGLPGYTVEFVRLELSQAKELVRDYQTLNNVERTKNPQIWKRDYFITEFAIPPE